MHRLIFLNLLFCSFCTPARACARDCKNSLLQGGVSGPVARPDGYAALGTGRADCVRPYTREAYEEAREWIAGHGIFPPSEMGAGRDEDAILEISP